MKTNLNTVIKAILFSGVLVTSSVWAAAGSCNYAAASVTGGSGMGGTGMLAEGTGIEGAGTSQGLALADLKLAGKVISSRGVVEAQNNGRSRLLAKGDPVCVGEMIVTHQSGMVQIKMVDNGLIAIKPQTQLKIEKFAYNRTSQDFSLISLFKGASRFVTGQLGKLHPQNDLIRTPNATIGVRGTDHIATVILPGNSAGYAAGTYDKVNQGITFIKTDKGEIDIHPNQVGQAANMNEVPVLMNGIPEFYKDDAAVKDQGDSAEQGKTGTDSGDGKSAEPAGEHAGRGGEITHPVERHSFPGEHHSNVPETTAPESPSVSDTHHSPMLEMPEGPSAPQILESISVPQMPEEIPAPQMPEGPES